MREAAPPVRVHVRVSVGRSFEVTVFWQAAERSLPKEAAATALDDADSVDILLPEEARAFIRTSCWKPSQSTCLSLSGLAACCPLKS